jgi:hypothetical protein
MWLVVAELSGVPVHGMKGLKPHSHDTDPLYIGRWQTLPKYHLTCSYNLLIVLSDMEALYLAFEERSPDGSVDRYLF